MIELKRITDPADPDALALIKLHKDTFPEYIHFYETPLWAYMIKNCTNLYFDAVYKQSKLVGMLAYWDLEDSYYLQFIAIYPEFRNQKIGQYILNWCKENLQKTLFLESEVPYNEITSRRLNFYKRNGFTALSNNPEILASIRDKDCHPLWFMSNQPIDNIDKYLLKVRDIVYYAGE